ncbi:MAG: TonB-dependent receptor, partial [Crocinitomicaceae bacterium]|nr:TonB-dependent receptor [Crocinitomicaceae bacterium]
NSNVRYNLEKRKGWQTSIGASGMYQTNANKGMEFLIPEYHLLDEGVFMVTQKTWRKLSFSGGVRLDNRFVNSKELLLDSVGNPVKVPDANSILKFHSFSKNYNGISGSLGCAYQLGDFSTFKFNLSRGYRAPSIAELASNGRHEGTFRYELGNTNLKSEISNQLDFAYFIQTEHVVLEFTPFVNFISNYIYSEKLKADNGRDSIPVQGDPAPAFKFMSSSATLLGGEIYLDVHPHPLDFLHVENSFSFVQATQSNQPDSSKYLPFIPAPKYRFELRSQFNRVGKKITNAYVKFAINHIFTQNRVLSANGTETITPGYTLLSAGIGGNLSAFSRKDFLSLFISGENLTNVAFQNHLSRLKYASENLATGRFGIYNMGRNISLKVIVNF